MSLSVSRREISPLSPQTRSTWSPVLLPSLRFPSESEEREYPAEEPDPDTAAEGCHRQSCSTGWDERPGQNKDMEQQFLKLREQTTHGNVLFPMTIYDTGEEKGCLVAAVSMEENVCTGKGEGR